MSALDNEREAPTVADEHGFAGTVYSWWRGDPLPELPPIEVFTVRVATVGEISSLSGDAQPQEIERRVNGGDVAYVARLGQESAAWGWSAWREAQIGELGIQFHIPAGNRYLWDFVTLPAWRGRRIYPHMLQEIVRLEGGEAERFWIGHEPGNRASSRGVLRAGFQVAGGVWFREGHLVFVGETSRSEAAAAVLGIPFVPGR